MLFKRTLAATAIVLGTAFAANAADVPPIVVAPPPAPPAAPAPMAPAADWTGAYFGVWGAGTFFGGPPVWFNVGTLGGYDIQFGRVVAGVNFRGGITLGPGAINVEAGARIGFLLGDRILAYGNGAFGALLFDGPYYSFGGGVEFAANETLHIFAEVRRSVLACCGPNISVHAGVTLR
jgi:hypothetical protein